MILLYTDLNDVIVVSYLLPIISLRIIIFIEFTSLILFVPSGT